MQPREVTAVLHTASENGNVVMLWKVYELIWFNLVTMIDATKLYILILK